jgi:hypothetical protein
VIPVEPAAFVADKRKFHDKSYKNSSHSSNGGKRNSYFCEHCKIYGHSIERCFKIHGYPNYTKSLPNKKFVANSVNFEENATHI